MSFHVGQKVVCIKSTKWRAFDVYGNVVEDAGSKILPTKGNIYVISKIVVEDGMFLALEGFDPFDLFWSEKFRPLKKTDISIFKAMLVSPPKVREKA